MQVHMIITPPHATTWVSAFYIRIRIYLSRMKWTRRTKKKPKHMYIWIIMYIFRRSKEGEIGGRYPFPLASQYRPTLGRLLANLIWCIRTRYTFIGWKGIDVHRRNGPRRYLSDIGLALLRLSVSVLVPFFHSFGNCLLHIFGVLLVFIKFISFDIIILSAGQIMYMRCVWSAAITRISNDRWHGME